MTEPVRGAQVIVEHARMYGKDCFRLNPEHYLDQLERKPNAVPFARPLLQTDWPHGYWAFYRRLVEQKGASEAGKDFVRILRCHMQHGAVLTAGALRDCAGLGLISADAILQVVAQARFAKDFQTVPLDMTAHPALCEYAVQLQDTARYQILIGDENEYHVA